MSDEFRRLTELYPRVLREADELRVRRRELRHDTVEATDDDHVVTATVGLDGTLRALTLLPAAPRRLDPQTLGELIAATVNRAQRLARARIAELTGERPALTEYRRISRHLTS